MVTFVVLGLEDGGRFSASEDWGDGDGDSVACFADGAGEAWLARGVKGCGIGFRVIEKGGGGGGRALSARAGGGPVGVWEMTLLETRLDGESDWRMATVSISTSTSVDGARTGASSVSPPPPPL